MSEPRSPEYPDPASHEGDGSSPELAPIEARQGEKRWNILYVLTLGTIGAIAAVALAYVFFFAV